MDKGVESHNVPPTQARWTFCLIDKGMGNPQSVQVAKLSQYSLFVDHGLNGPSYFTWLKTLVNVYNEYNVFG